MELDLLKNSWKKISVDVDSNEFDIISATRKQMKSPLEELKKRSKKQIIILPLLFIFLVVMAITVAKDNNNFLIYMALIILPLLMIYYYFNLRLIGQLEMFNGSVKNDIEIKIRKLIKSNVIYLNITRLLFLILIIFSEVLLRYNRFDLVPELALLSKVSFLLRLCMYVGILGMHYLISKYTFNLYFGKYLKQLRSILSDMQ
ncbi:MULTISPECIES: hypothetical protein [Chryseobacterium]|uniref:hypothetical protein n=1 Tax=Chryseobacterium TaxID=59732 RepID=UPI001BED12A9|nr:MULTISPECIES: hypothetical protein [Chryseobacterium]MBT2622568.1 hypothetical protein [Chryseobacterium sp. ISL-6]